MSKSTEYLQLFKQHAPEWFKKAAFVRQYHAFFKDFFQRENLERAEWPDIQKIGAHLHCFQSMALAKGNALGKPNHPIEHYRKSFLFLAHGPGEPAERIRRFTNDGEYRLDYFGKSAVSELVGYLFPEQFMFVNARDKFAAKFLGIEVEKAPGGDLVSELTAFSKATRPVAQEYQEIVGKQTDLPLNLEVDQFFSWLYENHAEAEEKESLQPSQATQYWTLSVGTGGEYWEEFYQHGIAAIGWDGTPDLRQFKSKEEIREKLQELWPSDAAPKNAAHACWQFVHDINPGDIILAKYGRTKLLGYGVVQGDYEFDGARTHSRHTRKVNWLAKGNWEMPAHEQMALKTLTNVTAFPEFLKLVESKVGLATASKQTNTPDVPASTGIGYWWLNANPDIWEFDDLSIGQKQTYTSHNEKGNKRQKYKYFQAVKLGDIIVGYMTSPLKEVVAICKITKALHEENGEEKIEFEKVEQLGKPVDYAILQANPDLTHSEPIVSNQGSLFKLTEQEFEIIRSLIDDTNISAKVEVEPYDKKKAMKGLFLSEAQFDEMLEALKEKKNVVLQGAPGVGKTYVARRVAYALIGSKDPERVEMIQFHQSYSYEDFIQGFRPTAKGHFDLKYGIFHQFCRRAQREEAQGKPYVFIIDEINRGNLSKVFGELMMLVEADKRGKEHAIPLTYSQDAEEKFYIPENLHLIGMMNTADRSLAMVDYALRRRFRFINLRPEFSSEAFRDFLLNVGAKPELVKRIVARMNALNEVITADNKNLGPGYQIGHSYFCPRNDIKPNDNWYRRVIDSEIVPLIQEYWFDRQTGGEGRCCSRGHRLDHPCQSFRPSPDQRHEPFAQEGF